VEQSQKKKTWKETNMGEERMPLGGETSVPESMRAWQQELIRWLLIALILCSAVPLGMLAYNAYQNHYLEIVLPYLAAYALLILVTFWRQSYALQVTLLLSIFGGAGVFELMRAGLGSGGQLLLLPFPLLATVLLGGRAGGLAWLFTILATSAIGWAVYWEIIVIPPEELIVDNNLTSWQFSALFMGTIGSLLATPPGYLLRCLAVALRRSHELVQSLEQRVSVEQEQRQRLQVANQEIAQRAALEQEQSERLQRLVDRIHAAASDMAIAATEIMIATEQQSAGANQQLAAITQTITTVDEVNVIAQQSVNRAQEVADTAQQSVQISHSGQAVVQQTIASMAQIKTRVEGIAENILALSEQTQQIGAIIATVNEIAAQSKMLALNASVEAARAGEHGKGFAVVAVEVRNLAEQSRQATAQIKAILSDIQRATNVTALATQEGAKKVDEGGRLAAQAGDVIEQLAFTIGKSAQAAAQVVAGGQQQTSGVQQIAQAIQRINQATLQSLDSTRQVSQAAQNLNRLARELAESVELQT
jgi:methyl-accepting chemotaxis protein